MADSIIVRPAELADVHRMADVFFQSFNQSLWEHFCPENDPNRSFIVEMWTKGIKAATDRTFVAVDTATSDMIIGFSRWQVPIYDQSVSHDSWPEPSMLDRQIAVPFFDAEALSRRTIMGGRPHWYLDLIGVRECCWGRGVAIATKLIEWGIKMADLENLEVFLHGTEMAYTFYQQVKKYGFQIVGEIHIPDHPAYGTYRQMSMIRAPKIQEAVHTGKRRSIRKQIGLAKDLTGGAARIGLPSIVAFN